MDTTEFDAFMLQIVENEMPDETDLYLIWKDTNLPALFDGTLKTKDKTVNGDFNMFPDAAHAKVFVEFLGLVLKTYELIKEFMAKRKKQKEPLTLEELMKKWESDLISAGVPAHKAKDISIKYTKDLAKVTVF
jgi:hypothetical protein